MSLPVLIDELLQLESVVLTPRAAARRCRLARLTKLARLARLARQWRLELTRLTSKYDGGCIVVVLTRLANGDGHCVLINWPENLRLQRLTRLPRLQGLQGLTRLTKLTRLTRLGLLQEVHAVFWLVRRHWHLMWLLTRLARLTRLTIVRSQVGNRQVGLTAHDRQARQSAHDGVDEHAGGTQSSLLARLTNVCESMTLLLPVLRRQICRLLTRLAKLTRLLTRLATEGGHVNEAAHG